MAKQNKAQRDKNTTERMTPFDVKVKGTFAEKPKAEKAPPRKPTPEETHANNYAGYDLGYEMGSAYRLIPVFLADLRFMNEGKVGRPFEFSEALIVWIASFLAFSGKQFREVSGMLTGMLEPFGLKIPSYTRLCERVNELYDRVLEERDEALRAEIGDGLMMVRAGGKVLDRVRRVGIDSTGMNLSSTTMWRGKKWKTFPKDMGWIKLHALSDVDSGEIIAFAITTEKVGDAPLLKPLLEAAVDAGHRISVVYADGAYSSDANWRFVCEDSGMRFVTSFKVTTAPTSNGSPARGRAAKLWCSMPYDEWVVESGYGTRWKCECTFSDLKRKLDETVKARSLAGRAREVAEKVGVHNRYKEIRAELMGVTGNGVIIA